jgi:hypothetical protein
MVCPEAAEHTLGLKAVRYLGGVITYSCRWQYDLNKSKLNPGETAIRLLHEKLGSVDVMHGCREGESSQGVWRVHRSYSCITAQRSTAGQGRHNRFHPDQ